MIAIKNLTYHIGGRIIYEDASLHINEGDKIGLVGLNGTGKSTLLKIISGEITPESIIINKEKDCTIGFLNQDLLSYSSNQSIKNVGMQAFSNLLEIQKKIDQIADQIHLNYSDKLLNELTELQDLFTSKGGYEIEAKTEMMLMGIGFSKEQLDNSLDSFSGGWRMRVMFAKLLLEEHSLIMLDEPTNHLDLVSIQWIESYLKKYQGAVMIVSHDRVFLDKITNKTFEVANNLITSYAGNYSFYEKEKATRRELQEKSYQNQQQKIKETEKFIDKFRAKASKAKQAQSRIKSLEKIERIEKVSEETKGIRIKFSIGKESGKVVLTAKGLAKSYEGNQVIQKTNLEVIKGDRIALIGANGKGKSTLIKIIAENDSKDYEGDILLGYNVIKSFFAQHQLDALVLENTVFQELSQVNSKKVESDIRRIAGMLLFSKDDIQKKISVLSGGEKSRVALAKVLLMESNFLLLDEPTNHLDMNSVSVLANALHDYEGTFIVVSHDRHFLSIVANKIWYIENQQVKEFLGTYNEYEIFIKERIPITK